MLVTATVTPEKHRERYATGSVRIPTAQPLGDLATALLEPNSAFAASPADRRQWIYRHTPFYDPRALLYPVGREE